LPLDRHNIELNVGKAAKAKIIAQVNRQNGLHEVLKAPFVAKNYCDTNETATFGNHVGYRSGNSS
jgi:hypothetical protein